MSRARPSVNCQARRHVSSDDVAAGTQFSARWAECLHCWQQLQAAASGYLSYLLAAKADARLPPRGYAAALAPEFPVNGGSSGCQRWRATSVCQSATIESVQNGRARKQESTMKTSTKYAAPCWRLRDRFRAHPHRRRRSPQAMRHRSPRALHPRFPQVEPRRGEHHERPSGRSVLKQRGRQSAASRPAHPRMPWRIAPNQRRRK